MTQSPKSYVQISSAATAFVGRDATEVFRAKVIRRALKTYEETGRNLFRGPIKNVLNAAGRLTGKSYPGRAYGRAIADLDAWIAKAESSLPVERA